MKIFKNSVCVLISLLMVFTVFTACSNGTVPDGGADSSANRDADLGETADPLDAVKPDIPDLDFGGYEFTILSCDDGGHGYPLHTRDISADKETGDQINDAVYFRNREAEERFNIKIKHIAVAEPTGGVNVDNCIKDAVLAGEDLYDLVYPLAVNGVNTAAAGYLLNWNILPYIDMSKPWWCEGAVKGLAVGKKLFLALSDLSVSTNQYAYMIYYNKDLQKEYDVENLYELVRTGKWVFDKVPEVTKGVTTDLNGDGVMDDDDRYGAIISYAALNFFYAGGNIMTPKDENNIPYLDIVTERSLNTFEKAYDICHSDYVRYAPGWENETEMMNMFIANKTLLYFHSLSKIDRMRNMEHDFGVLPYPKLDERQEKYYTYTDAHQPLLGVPKTASDLERNGAVIEELSYLSTKYLLPAYYDVTLKTKFARDLESAEMLDYIFGGRVFDFGYFYDIATAYIFQSQISADKREFASAIEARSKAAQANLEKILKAYEEAE